MLFNAITVTWVLYWAMCAVSFILFFLWMDARDAHKTAQNRLTIMVAERDRERRNLSATILILKNELKEARESAQALIDLTEINKELDLLEEIDDMTEGGPDYGIGI